MRWRSSRKAPGMNCGEQRSERSCAVAEDDRDAEAARQRRFQHDRRVRRGWNIAVRILLLTAIALLVGAALNRIAMLTDSDWQSVVKRLLVG